MGCLSTYHLPIIYVATQQQFHSLQLLTLPPLRPLSWAETPSSHRARPEAGHGSHIDENLSALLLTVCLDIDLHHKVSSLKSLCLAAFPKRCKTQMQNVEILCAHLAVLPGTFIHKVEPELQLRLPKECLIPKKSMNCESFSVFS